MCVCHTYNPNHLLWRLDQPQRSRHERLEHWPAVLVEQVDLVDDEESYRLRVKENETKGELAVEPRIGLKGGVRVNPG